MTMTDSDMITVRSGITMTDYDYGDKITITDYGDYG